MQITVMLCEINGKFHVNTLLVQSSGLKVAVQMLVSSIQYHAHFWAITKPWSRRSFILVCLIMMKNYLKLIKANARLRTASVLKTLMNHEPCHPSIKPSVKRPCRILNREMKRKTPLPSFLGQSSVLLSGGEWTREWPLVRYFRERTPPLQEYVTITRSF